MTKNFKKVKKFKIGVFNTLGRLIALPLGTEDLLWFGDRSIVECQLCRSAMSYVLRYYQLLSQANDRDCLNSSSSHQLPLVPPIPSSGDMAMSSYDNSGSVNPDRKGVSL